MNRPFTAALLLLAPLVAVFLGYLDLHTDDTGVEVVVVLAVASVYGFGLPRWAWLSAAGIAAAVLSAEVLQHLLRLHTPFGPASPWWAPGLVVVPALLGAYFGALCRKAVSTPGAPQA